LSFRFLIPGLLWTAAMGLLFSTPQNDPPYLYFGFLPARALLHCLLFLGFVHIWIGACKKQLKHDKLRKNAIPIVFAIAILLALSSELLIFGFGINVSFSLWNLIFDIIGACLGILTFKLLYQSCY